MVDGSFNEPYTLAALGLLGTGKQFGWWRHPFNCQKKIAESSWGKEYLQGSSHESGECEGWKLPSSQIPRLNFLAPDAVMPSYPPRFEHNWKSYYEWRGLPLASPAALLLRSPLTIFKMLHVLGFSTIEYNGPRKELRVYLLDVGVRNSFLILIAPHSLYRLVVMQHELEHLPMFVSFPLNNPCERLI